MCFFFYNGNRKFRYMTFILRLCTMSFWVIFFLIENWLNQWATMIGILFVVASFFPFLVLQFNYNYILNILLKVQCTTCSAYMTTPSVFFKRFNLISILLLLKDFFNITWDTPIAYRRNFRWLIIFCRKWIRIFKVVLFFFLINKYQI